MTLQLLKQLVATIESLLLMIIMLNDAPLLLPKKWFSIELYMAITLRTLKLSTINQLLAPNSWEELFSAVSSSLKLEGISMTDLDDI